MATLLKDPNNLAAELRAMGLPSRAVTAIKSEWPDAASVDEVRAKVQGCTEAELLRTPNLGRLTLDVIVDKFGPLLAPKPKQNASLRRALGVWNYERFAVFMRLNGLENEDDVREWIANLGFERAQEALRRSCTYGIGFHEIKCLVRWASKAFAELDDKAELDKKIAAAERSLKRSEAAIRATTARLKALREKRAASDS